ncbi:MAG: response regulator transcription factor [Pseudomonadota bacterium]
MPASGPIASKDADVFAPTEKGNRQLKSAGTSLSATELQLLVLIDGVSSVAEIAQCVPHIPRAGVGVALRKLAADKLVVCTSDLDSDVTGSGFSTIAVPAGFFSGLSADPNPEADKGVSALTRRGYYVSIARRPAEPREAKEGWRPTILVVDDDPDLQKLFRMYLSLEGFAIRSAVKRDEIVLGLGKQPAPDLVLLDVNLPDANGFDVLAKMRLHPVFRNMPVIMLTGEATREAVLKGLRGGANGYLTKPFQPDILTGAVKAVLGLSAPAGKKE